MFPALTDRTPHGSPSGSGLPPHTVGTTCSMIVSTPIVIMMTTNGGSPVSLRRTVASVITPTSAPAAIARTSDR